jgi:hypothetical protein
MAAPQIISVWAIFINSNFEQMGNALFLEMRPNRIIAGMLDDAWQRSHTLVGGVNVADLQLWKIKTPVRRPPRYNLRSSEARPNNDDTPTLENLLENIKSSDIGSHAEYLDEAEELIDCFREENRENKIQALILCPRMPRTVAFVRSH